MPSRKTATVVAISGTILVGGVAYVLWKRRQNNGEHDDATDSAAFSKKMTTTVNDSALSNNKAFANAISTRQTEIDVSMATKSDSVHVYEALGLIMKLVPNWKIADDVAPLPNMAMITIQNSNYSYDNESMCGKAPLLILSIEDVSLEKLDAQEFKAKSKAIALRQMHAMTNGMIPPNITFDGKEVNGPFQMKFQYSILSPMLQLQVVNYITVVNELAYVLQFMASPDVFQACESDVLKIAHQVEITNIPTHPTSFTEIAVRNGIQLRMPASWIISGVADAETSPFVIETPSPTKPDRVEILYKKANYTEQDIKEICEKDAGSKLKLTSEHGYKSGTYVKFNKTIMVCSKGNFFVRVTPMQASSSTITKAELQNLVDSMEYGAPKKDYMTYKNRRYEFSIDVQPNSRLVESRIGDTAITFAPEGIIMDPTSTEPKPLLTIRIGDPSTEADCETSLEGWMTRMKHEFAMAGGQVTDLRFDSINEHKCLTFSEVQSQETMMGQEENKAKIIVFVQDGRTYMLRWEVPKTAWNQFEATMYKLLETFKFTC